MVQGKPAMEDLAAMKALTSLKFAQDKDYRWLGLPMQDLIFTLTNN